MAIKTYSTELGLFSVVCDTTIYNSVTSQSSFLGAVIDLPLVFTVLYNYIIPANLQLMFQNYFPNSVFVERTADTVDVTSYITAGTNRQVSLTERYRGGYGDYLVAEAPVGSNGSTISMSSARFPHATAQSSIANASNPNVIEFAVLITDDEMVNYKIGRAWIKDDGTTQARGYSALSSDIAVQLNWWFRGVPEHTPIDPGDDPYGPGGDSTDGGGNGTFDYDSVETEGFDDFNLPDNSAVDTGFLTLYNPSAAELKSLSNYLWSNSFDLDTFKKLVNDPMDLILGLSILPIQVPQGERREIGIGLIGTDIYMTTIPSQWVKIDCGSVTIPNFTGSYLDYDPYTSVEIYLPFIGTRTLKADEVMGRTISVGYAVDILSGACVAWIDVDGSLMYTYMGQCATSIPVVSGDWTNVINGILSVVGSAAGGAIKGGVGGAIAGGVAAASSVAVNDSKISVERSGNISGAAGLLAYKRPFIIINAPRICKPANQNIYTGYPSYITQRIGDISGYTEIEVLRLYNIPATDPEIDEIRSLLMGGVIL